MELVGKFTHRDPVIRRLSRRLGGAGAKARSASSRWDGQWVGERSEFRGIKFDWRWNGDFGGGSGAGQQGDAGYTAEVQEFPSCDPQDGDSIAKLMAAWTATMNW